jgi:hypothetical protein
MRISTYFVYKISGINNLDEPSFMQVRMKPCVMARNQREDILERNFTPLHLQYMLKSNVANGLFTEAYQVNANIIASTADSRTNFQVCSVGIRLICEDPVLALRNICPSAGY